MVQAGARGNEAGICPCCQKRIEGQQYKFCPFCGANLLATASSTEPERRYDSVMTVDEIIRIYEQFITEKKRQGLPDDVIQAAAAELVKPLKAKVQTKIHLSEKPRRMVGSDSQEPAAPLWETDIFSVVLKYCPDQEQLADRLHHYLLRSLPAIRMALAATPSLVIYQRKLDKMVPILREFVAGQATIALIPGRFVSGQSFPQLYPAWNRLDAGTRRLIDAAPPLLWAGQKFYAVHRVIHEAAAQAALVIGDQGLYLLSGDIGAASCRWRDIPYYFLEDVYTDGSAGTLEIVHRHSGQEEEIAFSSLREAEVAYEAIQRAMREGYSNLQIRRHCPKCGAVGQEYVFRAYERDQCEHCGFNLERKLLYR